MHASRASVSATAYLGAHARITPISPRVVPRDKYLILKFNSGKRSPPSRLFQETGNPVLQIGTGDFRIGNAFREAPAPECVCLRRLRGPDLRGRRMSTGWWRRRHRVFRRRSSLAPSAAHGVSQQGDAIVAFLAFTGMAFRPPVRRPKVVTGASTASHRFMMASAPWAPTGAPPAAGALRVP